MSKKTPKNKLVSKIASQRVVSKNADAFKVFDAYKKTTDIIERAEFSSGKKVAFRSDTGSTLNFEINRYGAYSTTAQNI